MDVLLVEDDRLDAEMVTQILKRDSRTHYRLTHVETLEQCLDRLECEHFDIVLIGLNLPDAAGDDAVNRISLAYNEVPAVILSGNADPEFAIRAIRAGAQDFIVKGAESAMELPRAMAYAVERKTTEMRLKQLASYDPLTKLANRQEFCTQLEKACARADRHDTMVALMVLDLDHFKMINDTHGHQAGDDLLCSVADTLRSGSRAGDTAARLGGDEFAVILEDIPNPQSVMRWSRKMIDNLNKPVTIGDTSHPVSASIGGALYPLNGRTVDELIRSADMAMYDVKRSGRGNVALYDDAMDQRRQRHFELESDLPSAIANQQLAAYFQPKVSLGDGALVGIEALCRWHRPNGETIEPAEFLPMARRLGLMPDVGMFMLDAVTQTILQWRRDGGPNVPVSINADAQEISSPVYASRVINQLKTRQLQPEALTIEITETTLIEPSAACLDNLNLLRRSGVRIELDNFGAGHATFNYLRQFPLDALKLDRTLVSGLGKDPQCVTIVSAMIALGRDLGLDIIADGIESAEQWHALREIGCEVGQGFQAGRPMRAELIAQWRAQVPKAQDRTGVGPADESANSSKDIRVPALASVSTLPTRRDTHQSRSR